MESNALWTNLVNNVFYKRQQLYQFVSSLFFYFCSAPLGRLRKATIKFVVSVWLCVCPHETIRIPMNKNLQWRIFTKIFRKHSGLIKTDKNNGKFTRRCTQIYNYFGFVIVVSFYFQG